MTDRVKEVKAKFSKKPQIHTKPVKSFTNESIYAKIRVVIVHYLISPKPRKRHGTKTFADIELVVRASAKVMSRKRYG